MNRLRYPTQQSNQSGEKAQLVLAYQELGKELHSTQLKVIGNYTLGRIIGQGSFGTVRLGVHRLTGCRVAIKSIPKSSSPPLLTREIHHHRRLHHPNVVQLYEVIATEHTIWLITELCPGGELFDYLVENIRFSETEARRIFGQICLGLGYVHHHGVVHRDLKLENVLLDERCNPKIADFGFGREFEPRKLLDTYCGTTGYAAPEMLAGRKYLGQEVDIWSLGIILHSLLTGSLPFDDDDEEVMKAMIMAGDFEVPSFLSMNAADLIKSILQQDPKARPSIENILSHSWFTVSPSQHIFLDESVLRPPTIAEEGPATCESPSLIDSIDGPKDTTRHLSSHPKSTDSDRVQAPTLIAYSDTSESSERTSDLGIGSSRGSTSSPITAEDSPARFPGIPDLNTSSTALPSPSQALQDSSSNGKPASESLPLRHRHSSNLTIKNQGFPPADLTLANPGRSSVTPDKNTRADAGSSSEQTARHLTIQIPDSESSSNSSTAPNRAPNSKRRPPSLGPCLPSAVSVPQVRTPSRTKRRSIGSVMSERIGPLDDLVIQSELTTPTGGNPSRLSASSLSAIVIDYLAALKATKTKPSLMSENDLELLKSLSVLGVDTGQMIHSVKSNACDSSGAMWWLLKRKMDKQAAEKELLERLAHRVSSSGSVRQLPSDSPAPFDSAFPSADLESREAASSSGGTPSRILTMKSSTLGAIPSASTPLAPSPLRSSERPGGGGRSSSPDKSRFSPMSFQRADPPSNMNSMTQMNSVDDGPHIVEGCPITPPESHSNSSKKRVQAASNQYPGTLREDAQSSTSSLRADTSSDRDSSGLNLSPSESGKKLTPERRKRSQSVSMLQRATHALAPKKSHEEKQTKSRARETIPTPEPDLAEKALKTPKKDQRAREREVRAGDEPSKSSSPSLSLSLLFSRKVVLLPPLPSLPSSIVLSQSAGESERVEEAEDGKAQGLVARDAHRTSISMPSSPSKDVGVDQLPRRDSDPATSPAPNEESDLGKALSPSNTITPTSTVKPTTHSVPVDVFKTPKPGSSPGKFRNSTPANKHLGVKESSLDPSPTHSSFGRIESSEQTEPSPSNKLVPPKGSRSKVNLFSTFRLWFNEDRRKRKRNIPMSQGYSSANSNSFRPQNRNHPRGSELCSPDKPTAVAPDKILLDSAFVRHGHASTVPIHRQGSKSSRRPSLQSTPRQRSSELVNSQSARKRRSDSSRASLGSYTGNRTPTSDKGSFNSASQHAVSIRTPSDSNSAKRPTGHLRQASTGSNGSRRSSALAPLSHNVSLSPGRPGFARRASSHGTTVRRIATTGGSSSKSRGARRSSKTFSSSSSVRTSMSSDEGSGSQSRSFSTNEEHRMHSPANAYDVEATIEEEDDDGDDDGGVGGEAGGESSFGANSSIVKLEADDETQTRDARRSALQKLSGDGPGEKPGLLGGSEEGKGEGNSANGVSRTIFMAHKPYSVFGTPTQAFFGRSIHSPLNSKFSNQAGGGGSGNSGGSSYANLMKSIADGPQPGKQRKYRDVFANKVTEDGEWIDVDEEDDVCSKYGGGLGQSVQNRRGEGIGLTSDRRKETRVEELVPRTSSLASGHATMKLIDVNSQDSLRGGGGEMMSPGLGGMSKFKPLNLKKPAMGGGLFELDNKHKVDEDVDEKKGVRRMNPNSGTGGVGGDSNPRSRSDSSTSTIKGFVMNSNSKGSLKNSSSSKNETNSNQSQSIGITKPQPQQSTGLIGNWRGGNHRGLPTLKTAAIEEEEEEEE